MSQRFRSTTIREGVVRSTTLALPYAFGEDDEDIARSHIVAVHVEGSLSYGACRIAPSGSTARRSARGALPPIHLFYATPNRRRPIMASIRASYCSSLAVVARSWP